MTYPPRLEWRDCRTFALFSYEGWREPNEFMHHCSAKWATILLRLKDLVEKGEGRAMDTKIAVGA